MSVTPIPTAQPTGPTINLGLIREKLQHLEDLAIKAKAAQDAYAQAIKAVSE